MEGRDAKGGQLSRVEMHEENASSAATHFRCAVVLVVDSR